MNYILIQRYTTFDQVTPTLRLTTQLRLTPFLFTLTTYEFHVLQAFTQETTQCYFIYVNVVNNTVYLHYLRTLEETLIYDSMNTL